MRDDEKHLHIEFFVDTVENKRKSAAEGRPVFDEVELIRIKIAGDKNRVLVNPVNARCTWRENGQLVHGTYAERFAERYEMWSKERVNAESGTPLTMLPAIGLAKREELKALNIHTIEALANLDGANLTKLGMGGRDLKNKAQAYLDSVAGTAPTMKLMEQIEALKAQMTALQDENAELARTKGATKAAPATEPAEDRGPSPFDTWPDDDIVNWIVDNGGERPHHKSGHAKIVAAADELNEQIAKANEAA